MYRQEWFLLGPSILWVLGLTGCSRQDEPLSKPSVPQMQEPAAVDFIVSTSKGELKGAAPIVSISYDPSVPAGVVRLALGAADLSSQTSWGGAALIDPQVLLGGTFALTVTDTPLTVGAINVTLQAGATPIYGHAGTLTLTLSKGKLTGMASVDPTSLSASLTGKYSIQCSVPKSMLGQTTNGTGGPVGAGAAEEYAIDTTFSTNFCRPFASLAP